MLELNKVYKTGYSDSTVKIVYTDLNRGSTYYPNVGIVTQTNEDGTVPRQYTSLFSDTGECCERSNYNNLILPKKIKEGDTVKSENNTTVHIIKIVDGYVYGWFDHFENSTPIMGKWAEHNGNPVLTTCYSVGKIPTTVDE